MQSHSINQYLRRLWPAAGLLAGSLLCAQTNPNATVASTPPPPPEEAEVQQLSPFEVVAENRGYLGLNTLSGTRLNSRLEDLAASITVVTKEQMEDTAAVDINDIFLYEANTEGTGNYTSFTTNRDGGVIDNIQENPQTANRVRGLSSANRALANFAVDARIPLDPYNTESVEISRGPNSNIFGLGVGAGTVNVVPTSALTTRSITNLTGRVDSFGGYRASIDVNRGLFEEKLGLRISALSEDKGFERDPSREEIRRWQAAVTIKPFKSTTIKATAEFYRNEAQRPNNLTPRETITEWLAAGSPSWDPSTLRVKVNGVEGATTYPVSQDRNLPAGLIGGPLYNRASLYIEPDGTVGHYSVNRTGNAASPLTRNRDIRYLQSATYLMRNRPLDPLSIDPGITDKAIYDYESINYIAPNLFEDEADTYLVEVEQFIIDTPHHLVAAKAGYFQQNFSRYARNMVSSNDTIIFVDVNEKRLDGTANPYFGRPYVTGGWPLVLDDPNDIKMGAVDLVYQWTPERKADGLKLLGQQRLNFHGEMRRRESTNFRYRDYTVSDHTWINPVNRTNSTQTQFLYFLGDAAGNNLDYAPTQRSNMSGDYVLNWRNGVTNTFVQENTTLGEAAVTGTDTDQQEIDSFNVAYQGFFWDDRIVTTLGFRRDKQKLRNSADVVVDPATGFITYDPIEDFSNSVWVEDEGDTKTYGVVFKPTRWLSVFYNFADSFNPLNEQYDVFGQLMPNPTSEGKDYGFALNLFEGKFYLRVSRYDTIEINSRRSQISTIGSRIHRLEGWREPFTQSFYPWAEDLALSRFQQQGVANPTQEQLFDAAAAIMQLDPTFLRRTAETGAVGVPVDITSEGWEFEGVYNPTPNWSIKFNLAQQVAIDDNIGESVTDYIAERMPVWTTVTDDQGNRWWDFLNGSPASYFQSDILTPLTFEVANSGNPRSQVREWRWNVLTNYDFTEGRMKGWSVGGALRWQDEAAIGFYGMPPESDGVVRYLDPERPILDDATLNLDLFAAYRFKFAGDKVRGRIQLNVRNVAEDGGLRAVAANPDGTPYAFRIEDPRQFILTTSFDL